MLRLTESKGVGLVGSSKTQAKKKGTKKWGWAGRPRLLVAEVVDWMASECAGLVPCVVDCQIHCPGWKEFHPSTWAPPNHTRRASPRSSPGNVSAGSGFKPECLVGVLPRILAQILGDGLARLAHDIVAERVSGVVCLRDHDHTQCAGAHATPVATTGNGVANFHRLIRGLRWHVPEMERLAQTSSMHTAVHTV